MKWLEPYHAFILLILNVIAMVGALRFAITMMG